MAFAVLTITSGLQAKPLRVLKGTITKVSDGDTVHFTPYNGDKITIRMLGTDSAEAHLPTQSNGVVGQQPWGDEATEALSELLPLGTKVSLEDYGTDKYGRILGRILRGNRDINLEMVEMGQGSPYILCEGKSCDENFLDEMFVFDYLEACASARKARRGIYGSRPLKELPFEFRIRMQNRDYEKFVGDVATREYYEPTDYEQVDVCNRVFFPKESDAKRAGFTPARRNRG